MGGGDSVHYKVKEVSDLVGISIRMLHHYDSIGLLEPESVSSAGYRLYNDSDLEKLQQIMLFRELDFGLQEIRDIFDIPDFNRKRALAAHKELLLEKKARLEKIIAAVDQTIEHLEGGAPLTKKDLFESFDMKAIEEHKAKYAAEVREKYGANAVESEKRTAGYSKKDWAEIMSKQGEIYSNIANNMDKGPADPLVQQYVAEWRSHITKYFYDCTPEIFRGLGDLYVDDERFTKNIDKTNPGLASFLRDAMHVYCDNLK